MRSVTEMMISDAHRPVYILYYTRGGRNDDDKRCIPSGRNKFVLGNILVFSHRFGNITLRYTGQSPTEIHHILL